MARVACTMMQKNEAILLEPWLRYHAYLFGLDNLYVFDNGSDDPDVIETLRSYEAQGLHIDWSHNTGPAYVLKGDIIADCIRRLQAAAAYDIVFPLDCDEFVAVKTPGGATCDPERIHRYNQEVLAGPPLLRVDTQLFNVINHPGEFAIQDYAKTVIVIDGTFAGSDHGHHFCTTTTGAEYHASDYAFVHYHYKPLAMLRDHARAKLAPFVDIDDPEAVAAFAGAGHHLRPYLTMTEDVFGSWHQGDGFYVFQEFNEQLRRLGATIPF